MLANASDETSPAVTTVRLPRTLSNGVVSPPVALRTAVDALRNKRAATSVGTIPEVADRSTGLQVLAQVGIVELLEQDDRPTFIIDLEEPANSRTGSLTILFANPALKAFPGLLDRVRGKPSLDRDAAAVPTTFADFRAWVTSVSRDAESTSVCGAPMDYDGAKWSSSTIQRRLRVISANPGIAPLLQPHLPSPVRLFGSPAAVRSPTQSQSPATDRRHDDSRTASDVDYFSGAPLPRRQSPETSSKSVPSAIPSVLSTGAAAAPDTTPTQPRGPPAAASTKVPPSPGPVAETLALRGAGPPDKSRVFSEDTIGAMQRMHSTSGEDGNAFFDWTQMPNSAGFSEHVQFARGVDWAATSLGPIEQWPSELRVMCNLIMASPYAAAMYWGPDLIVIYNEAYVALAGAKHPRLMGQSYKEAWAEIWDDVADVFANAQYCGLSTMKEDDSLFLQRTGALEETYFSWSIIPIIGEDGACAGLLNPAFEKTRRKIAERRMFTLRRVGECLATAREVEGFWAQIIKGLESNAYDAPFVLLYSVSDEAESDISSLHSNSIVSSRLCLLEGSLGVPEGHAAAPAQVDLRNCSDGFGRHFHEAAKGERPVVLAVRDGTLSSELLEGIEWRGFDAPCTSVVICPILPTTGDAVLGFFVMGINPRRPYCADYELFVQLLTRQLATSMASVVLFEEEIKRGQRAAQLATRDRIELSKQLAARTQEAAESDSRFTRMAELAPVGIFMADGEGRMTYFNEAWYEITRHPKQENNADQWLESVKEEDQDKAAEMWRRVVVDRVSTTSEFRFKAPWEARNGATGDTWVLASAYPEREDDGSLKSVFGSLTNISQQKWAEDFQKRRMEEAVELKRQQENFIDITSHEMRNPLSAILQCADEIASSLSEYRRDDRNTPAEVRALLESNIDAAQTIGLCAQHQKRIVDDVLTLSKLDSALLLVTPVDVQPVAVVQRALKMFEGELRTNDIEMKFEVLDSYRQLAIDWVRLDPSRLLQVLINLTTNAIKFTHARNRRTIVVSIGASRERPSKASTSEVSYFSTRSEKTDPTTGADWGTGEGVFLSFAVRDTGRGLDEDEKKLLFLRFSQASPRTHVQYGGSGLGLFISRELTELQGGEIGVSSESGKGSTFGFYVKARRSPAVADGTEAVLVPISPVNHFSTSRKRIIPVRTDSSDVGASTALKGKDNSHIKVLIVEDNLVNQRVLQKQLRNLGCVVHLANHGGEALDRLRESRFWRGREEDGLELSLILMDLEMPVMDGLTCAKEIRKYQESGDLVQHVPIIAVTANARPEQIQTALGAGMDDVVSKPFRIPELIPKIEELTSKYRILSPEGVRSASHSRP